MESYEEMELRWGPAVAQYVIAEIERADRLSVAAINENSRVRLKRPNNEQEAGQA